MRAGLLALVSALCFAPASASSAPADSSAVADSASASPIVETLLAAITVQGDRLMDRLFIADLDLVVEGGKHLLPVLRLLEAERVRIEETGEDLLFFSPAKEQVRLNPRTGRVAIAGNPVEAQVRLGRSDLTDRDEVWIEESVAARILGLSLEWKEDAYAYEAKPLGPLPAFERREEPSRRRLTELTSLGFELPELHPTALPQHHLMGVNFLSARLRGSMFVVRNENGDFEVNPFASTSISSWGPLLGGDYQLSLSANGGGSQGISGPVLERATWTLRGTSTEMSVGDRVFGLSQLVFPSVSTAGVYLNMLTGVNDATYQRDLSQLGSQPVFQPSLEISGEAPVGSRVELRINRQFVDEIIIKEGDGPTPGQGIYRFTGINVLTGRANEAQIRITHPDGVEEEIHREIIGSSELLRPGQLALVGGGGMKRNPSAGSELDPLYGQFAGIRGLVGVTGSLTAGLSAAWQEEFSSQIYSQNSFQADESLVGIIPPRSSFHTGAQASWRALSPLLVSMEGAWMRAPDEEEEGTAWTAESRLQFGETNMGLHGFTYSSDYFNGATERSADRRGIALDAGFQLTSRTRLSALAARAEDNVDRERPVTLVQNLRRLEVNTAQLIPRASMTIHGAFVTYGNEDTRMLAGVEVGGNLFRRLDYRATYFEGDDLRTNEDLLEGISIPGVFTFDIPRRYVELSYGLGNAGYLKASHNHTGGFQRTMLGHTLATSGGARRWAWAIDGGYDWSSSSTLFLSRFDYYLDQSKTGRLGVDVRRNPGGTWSWGLSVEHQGLLSFLGGGTRFTLGSRLNPDRGGIQGKVFHDVDADGILDPGETGLAGFRVVTERGSEVLSDQRGDFFLTNSGGQRLLRVSLEATSIPASYTPTNGTQLASIRTGNFTIVNLGLASLASIAGTVRVEGPEGTLNTVNGVRLDLLDHNGKAISQSITASNGSYYFGEVRSGDYTVRIDPATLPARYQAPEPARSVHVVADEEFEEVVDVDFRLTLAPTTP